MFFPVDVEALTRLIKLTSLKPSPQIKKNEDLQSTRDPRSNVFVLRQFYTHRPVKGSRITFVSVKNNIRDNRATHTNWSEGLNGSGSSFRFEV